MRSAPILEAPILTKSTTYLVINLPILATGRPSRVTPPEWIPIIPIVYLSKYINGEPSIPDKADILYAIYPWFMQKLDFSAIIDDTYWVNEPILEPLLE